LAGSDQTRHVHAGWRISNVLLRRVWRIEHQVRRHADDLVVHQKGSLIGEHVDNSRLAGSLESATLVSAVDCRFDFLFALTLCAFFFNEKSCWQRGLGAFCIKASWLRIPWSLPVYKARETIRSLPHLGIAIRLQDVDRSFA